MLKLQTPVDAGQSRIGISYKDRIMILGSCFADNIGRKMSDLGFNVCVNPFGTLYNPVSVSNSIQSLECGIRLHPDGKRLAADMLLQPPYFFRKRNGG